MKKKWVFGVMVGMLLELGLVMVGCATSSEIAEPDSTFDSQNIPDLSGTKWLVKSSKLKSNSILEFCTDGLIWRNLRGKFGYGEDFADKTDGNDFWKQNGHDVKVSILIGQYLEYGRAIQFRIEGSFINNDTIRGKIHYYRDAWPVELQRIGTAEHTFQKSQVDELRRYLSGCSDVPDAQLSKLKTGGNVEITGIDSNVVLGWNLSFPAGVHTIQYNGYRKTYEGTVKTENRRITYNFIAGKSYTLYAEDKTKGIIGFTLAEDQ